MSSGVTPVKHSPAGSNIIIGFVVDMREGLLPESVCLRIRMCTPEWGPFLLDGWGRDPVNHRTQEFVIDRVVPQSLSWPASGELPKSEVTAAIRGDIDAMRRVWVHHRRWIGAIMLAHKPRETDLEDLLQEVACTFVRSVRELRDESALKPWLRTVAVNQARLAGRKIKTQRRRQTLSLDASTGRDQTGSLESAASETRPHQHVGTHAEITHDANRLLELAQELPEGYREPLLLRCVQGMSYKSISDLLGLPETTIETRIARGRRMLRERASTFGIGSTIDTPKTPSAMDSPTEEAW